MLWFSMLYGKFVNKLTGFKSELKNLNPIYYSNRNDVYIPSNNTSDAHSA